MESAKVLPERLLLLWPDVLEVLAAEDDHASFCDEQGQLVTLDIAQLAQLQSLDLCPNSRGELRGDHFRIVGREEVRLGFVGESAFVDDFEGFCWREECDIIIDGEVLSVMVLVT